MGVLTGRALAWLGTGGEAACNCPAMGPGVAPADAVGGAPIDADCGVMPAGEPGDVPGDVPGGASTAMMRSMIWLPGARRATAAIVAGSSALPPGRPAGPVVADPVLAGRSAVVCKMARMLCPRASLSGGGAPTPGGVGRVPGPGASPRGAAFPGELPAAPWAVPWAVPPGAAWAAALVCISRTCSWAPELRICSTTSLPGGRFAFVETARVPRSVRTKM